VVVCVQVERAGMSQAAMDDLGFSVADERLGARLGGRVVARVPVPDDDPDLHADQSDPEQKRNADSAGSPSSSGSHRPS